MIAKGFHGKEFSNLEAMAQGLVLGCMDERYVSEPNNFSRYSKVGFT